MTRQYTGVICRLWHGWTRPEDADAYERYELVS